MVPVAITFGDSTWNIWTLPSGRKGIDDIARLHVNSIICYRLLTLDDHEDLEAIQLGVCLRGRTHVLGADVHDSVGLVEAHHPNVETAFSM